MTTILVVDDDPMILDSTKCFLESKGMNVICAKDGEEALSVKDTKSVDLALVDIFMPNRGGFETITHLHKSMPVIAMSGVSSHRFDPLGFAKSIGAKCSLSKPFAPDTLIETIQGLLFTFEQSDPQ
jgi:DNA-binding response OmpR family regulator